jgi:hypothetical protein
VKVKKWNAVAFWAYGTLPGFSSLFSVSLCCRLDVSARLPSPHLFLISVSLFLFNTKHSFASLDIENDTCAICHNALMVPCKPLRPTATSTATTN